METVFIHGVGSELQGVGRLADGRAVFVTGARSQDAAVAAIAEVGRIIVRSRSA